MAAGLEESFGGGGYTAQRAALLQMAWDHISSDLDSRESAFELHANGGLPTWRNRLRSWFDRYNELANGVLSLLDMEMPTIDMTSIRIVPQGPRRPVSVPARSSANSPTKSIVHDALRLGTVAAIDKSGPALDNRLRGRFIL